MVTIGFIGCGKMAEALIRAIRKNKITTTIIGSGRDKKNLERLKKELNIQIADNKNVVSQSDIVFLSVKPQNMDEVLDEIKGTVNNQLIVSIAAGIPIKRIAKTLNYNKIVRVMPNMPCLVGEMAAGYSCGNGVSHADAQKVEKLLKTGGIAFKVDEEHLDAIGALAGCGPAFVAAFTDVFVQEAVKEGLDKKIALQLASQTLIGTGKFLLEKKMSPQELIKMVASPGGVTVEGLKVLEEQNLKEIIKKTHAATMRRQKELACQ